MLRYVPTPKSKPCTKIKVTDIFVPCYAGEHYSGVDNADIQQMKKPSLPPFQASIVYDCSTENIGRQDQFHPCCYCNLQHSWASYITSTNPLVLFLHRICFLDTSLLPTLVRSVTIFFVLPNDTHLPTFHKKFGVIPFPHVMPLLGLRHGKLNLAQFQVVCSCE